MQIRNRIEILRYLQEHDPSYRVEDNVVFAPKAFVINTVIQWCYNQIEKEIIKVNEMEFYLMSIESFLRDESTISWDKEGNLVIS